MMFERITERLGLEAAALAPWAAAGALNVMAGAAILLVGLWLSQKASQIADRALGRAPYLDAMLRGFFAALIRYAVLTVTGLAALSKFGVQTTSVIAVLGAAGLAVGLALQGTLANLAAGVMLLIFRPFALGDRVQVGGSVGTVRGLSLVWTELASDDGVQIIVPNNSVWGQPLRNMTRYPSQPKAAEARIRVSDGADIDATLAFLRDIVAADSGIAQEPPPAVRLDRTAAENALEIVVTFAASEAQIPEIRSEIFRLARDLPKRPPPLNSP